MQRALLFGSILVLSSCLAPTGFAQEAVPVPVPPPLTPTPPASWTMPPAAELSDRGKLDGGSNYHIAADVGFGVWSMHGSGIVTPPMIGAAGSINLFSDRAGVGVGWEQFNQSSSKTGAWNYTHRP